MWNSDVIWTSRSVENNIFASAASLEMATNLSLLRKLETRAAIKFCKDLGKTPKDTYKMLQKKCGEKCVSRTLVFKRHKHFSEGRESLQDDSRPGQKSIVDAAQLTSVKEALDADRRRTVRELSELARASVGTVYNILTKNLKMRKVKLIPEYKFSEFKIPNWQKFYLINGVFITLIMDNLRRILLNPLFNINII